MTRFSAAFAAPCLLLLCATSVDVSANSTEPTPEQSRFMSARLALASGNADEYERLKASLSDYPIAHYLRFEELHGRVRREKPGSAHIALLNAFEKNSTDPALTGKLTRALQRSLADSEQWKLFLGVSKSRLAAEMPCSTIRARFETGDLDHLDEKALALWVEPKKPADVCKQTLATLEKNRTPPIKSIWERIYNAMEQDRPEYAKSMLHYLGTKDRKRVQNWLDALEKPERYLKTDVFNDDSMFTRRMFVDLVLAWSKTDTAAAMEHWQATRKKYSFFKDRYYDTHRLLAMRSAYRRMPQAYDWLNSLTAREDDLELKEWRVRAALYAQNWQQVAGSIKALPELEQQEDHWAYWIARTLEESGDADGATKIYTELSELQSYHGFLSADKLGLPYSIKDEPIQVEAELLESLQQNAGLQRSREYYAVDIAWEGRREWNAVQADATPSELEALAVLGQQWGMHDRAIFAAGLAERKRALTARFPVVHRQDVDAAALVHKIDPAWVFGVMRRESAYIQDVKSGAGAVGLMQLMPATAKFVAKMQGDENWRGDLTDAQTNIGLGTHYLRYVLDKFDDHQVLATASYNAGPRRVTSWLPYDDMQSDVWIDAIPYSETRRYVRAVMAYTAIYEWHLTGTSRRLSDKLLVVPQAEKSGV